MESINELTDDLDTEKRMTMIIERDDWRAVCNPDIERSDKHAPDEKYDAPFPFRRVGDHPSDEEISEQFAVQFNESVDEVYEKIEEADDPLDAILSLEAEDTAAGE